MDATWQSEFRRRMARFGMRPINGCMPVSIKVRVVSGCFHREHSPAAYRLIDQYLAQSEASNDTFQIEEHESGPEVLVYLTFATACLTFSAAIISLITHILKARSEGIKRGDKPSDPLEIILRGYWKDGEYFEERIIRIAHSDEITPKLIADALSQHGHQPPKKKSKKK